MEDQRDWEGEVAGEGSLEEEDSAATRSRAHPAQGARGRP